MDEMLMSEYLNVYLNLIFIGKLSKEKGRLSFVYDQQYVLDNRAPLSASLPLQVMSFDHNSTSPFFSGLLPDEPVRSRLAHYLHISSSNTFALLKAIGGECAGSISLYPPEDKINFNAKYQYKELNNVEANKLFASLERHPLLAGDEGIRISGAGAQNKLVISFVNGNVAIPLESTPSTHIIKPAIKRLEDTVFNEYFCMQLAYNIGLNVPKVEILWLDKTPYYLIRRYDRNYKNPKNILRLHQEDFCQALDISPEMKYENEGGPSLSKCFTFLDSRISNGKIAGINKINLFDAIIFNFIIGNGDAHGKNFSILYTESGEQLAPLYDLLCTIVYDNSINAKMAMKISSKYKFHDVQLRHFEQFAEMVGFKNTFLKTRVSRLIALINNHASQLRNELNKDSKYESLIYEKIIDVIDTNQKKLN